MGIEPLGSMMTVQAQGTVTTKPATPAQKTSEYTTANVQPTEKIDPMTRIVEGAQGKSQHGNSADPNGEQQRTPGK